MTDRLSLRWEDARLNYRNNISDNVIADNHDKSSESDSAEFVERQGHQETIEAHDTAIAAMQQLFYVDTALIGVKNLYVQFSLSPQCLRKCLSRIPQRILVLGR